MAGATTAERGEERSGTDGSGPPPPPRRRPRPRLRLPRSPRRRGLALLLALLLALGGFGTWALYGSDWLRIERVSVSWHDGSPRELTEDQILSAARVPVGSPMASLDRGAVRERLLDALPRLNSVDVVRAWPDGVSLKVTEREAEVLMRSADGYTEVDEGGVPFAEVARALPGVPLLELDLADTAGLRRFGEDRIRREAVAVAAALPDAVRRETRFIRVTSYDAITLELSGGRTVRWGSAEDSAAKADTLVLVMKAAEDATHFDVSVPSAPAVSGS
ncbi:cell division protein FtsQ/DivIB [Streptomyces sp. 6N223]|uniref:cell division protein FtsQ/DivIB n=1 Tax=Streptomyces sp. 6N223 TaxID=3457412 RepID=UPI003FCFCB0A